MPLADTMDDKNKQYVVVVKHSNALVTKRQARPLKHWDNSVKDYRMRVVVGRRSRLKALSQVDVVASDIRVILSSEPFANQQLFFAALRRNEG